MDLEFTYTIDNGLSLTFEAHEVYLPKPKLTVEGPGGVQASFDFQGARNETEGRMLTVTLDQRSRWERLRMISLERKTEPYELTLPYGVTVTVTPLTTAAMAAAQAEARKRLDGLEAQVKERSEAGVALDGLPNLDDDGAREGQYQALLIHSLAARHITAWSGIEDDPPVTPENVAALMDLYPVGERFIQEFTLRQVLLTAAKNVSGLSAGGTSIPAAGPDTAKPAKRKTKTAPKAASA